MTIEPKPQPKIRLIVEKVPDRERVEEAIRWLMGIKGETNGEPQPDPSGERASPR